MGAEGAGETGLGRGQEKIQTDKEARAGKEPSRKDGTAEMKCHPSEKLRRPEMLLKG